MTAPLGIDTPTPRFSWKMESERYDQRQAAYRIVVEEATGGAPVWTSEPNPSEVSVGVVYQGTPLKPCTRYNWTVTVWNAASDSAKATS